MKILIIDRYLGGHDGPGIYLYDLIQTLLERGHEIGFAYGKNAGDFFPKGIKTFPIPDLHRERYGTIAAQRALLNAYQSFTPDIASAQCLDVLWFAKEFSQYCPLVWNLLTHGVTCPNWTRLYRKDNTLCELDFGLSCTWHNFASGCGPKNPKALTENMLRVAAARASLAHVDAVQALTPYMRQTLENAGIPSKKIFDIPVYAPFFDENRQYTPPKRPLILFVGRLNVTKGPDLLLEACSQLQSPFELAIVGGGPLAESLEKQVEELGLQDRCQFYVTNIESAHVRTGKKPIVITREEMSPLFLSSSMVVFPSIWGEPSGIVRLEAMAHGRPLIAFDSGGSAQCIQDGVTGFVVPRLDVSLLRQRMEEILQNPALGESLGKAALEFITTEYHPVRLTQQMEEVFQRLIDARRARVSVQSSS